MEWVDQILEIFSQVPHLEFHERAHGKNRYIHGGVFTTCGAIFAEVYWGGEQQKSTLQLMIKSIGCSLVKDWQPIVTRLVELPKFKISRIDIALDCFNGSLTLEKVWKLRKNRELWVRRKGGRPPKFLPVGDMTEAGPEGRTLYMGTRDSDLYARIYEKGMQLFSFLGGSGNGRYTLMKLQEDGIPFVCGEYVRFECEFKAKTADISPNSLLDPDAFFAGAYPFCQNLIGHASPHIRIRFDHVVMNDLNSLLRQIRKQYGPSLKTAIEKLGTERTLEMVVAMHPNPRLVQNGVGPASAACIPTVVI